MKTLMNQKSWIVGMLLVLCASSSSFAKASFPLVCALKRGQDLGKLDGYLVQQGVRKGDEGGIKEVLTLLTLEKGKKVGSSALSGRITEFSAAQLQRDELAIQILRQALIEPSLVQSAKSIAISEGEPSVELVNFFDKEGLMLGGAIVVPVGGIQLCYPMSDNL